MCVICTFRWWIEHWQFVKKKRLVFNVILCTFQSIEFCKDFIKYIKGHCHFLKQMSSAIGVLWQDFEATIFWRQCQLIQSSRLSLARYEVIRIVVKSCKMIKWKIAMFQWSKKLFDKIILSSGFFAYTLRLSDIIRTLLSHQQQHSFWYWWRKKNLR